MNSLDYVLLEESIQQDRDETSLYSSECVYFIKDINTNHVKIGRTTDINRRFKQLQEPSVVQLEIFHLVYTDNSRWLEKWFHVIFKRYHLWGEIFNFPVQVLDAIKEEWIEI